MIHEEKTQTTCVLRLFGAPLWAVQQAVQQTGLAAQFRSRGAETLAALQAETPTALSKARKALADRFAAELYGEGEMTLVHAAVQALETSAEAPNKRNSPVKIPIQMPYKIFPLLVIGAVT